MKKYLFIFGLVGTALFTACSTSDDLTAEEPSVTPVVDQTKEASLIIDAAQNSDIPISIGVGSNRGFTRAVVNPDASGNFTTEAGKYLGVFCLATDIQSNIDESVIPEVIRTNNWNTAAEDDKAGLIVRMNNVPAKVTTDGTTSDVTFLDASTLTNPTPSVQHYYYPMGNWMKYNFYAYYPRQEKVVDGNTTLSFSANQVLEKYYEIDGSQDIIWGMSDQENATTVDPSTATDADPYCAKYFRLWKEADGANIENYYPKFEFKHKLMQLRFFVKAANSTVLTDLTSKNMKVVDMSISNAIYRLSLIVANKAEASKNGQLSMMSSLKTKELGIKEYGLDKNRFRDENGDDAVDAPFAIAVDDVTVTAVDGDGNPNDPGFVGYIMLPPTKVSDVDGFKYQLVVKVQYTIDAVDYTNEIPVALSLPTTESDNGTGKIYNIVVSVQSPQEVHAKATLAAWEVYDNGNNGRIDVNGE